MLSREKVGCVRYVNITHTDLSHSLSHLLIQPKKSEQTVSPQSVAHGDDRRLHDTKLRTVTRALLGKHKRSKDRTIFHVPRGGTRPKRLHAESGENVRQTTYSCINPATAPKPQSEATEAGVCLPEWCLRRATFDTKHVLEYVME